MKTLFLPFFFLFSAVITSPGQTLYFCNNYTDEGDPLGAQETWTMGPEGGYIYLLFNNGKKKIKAKSLFVRVARQDSSKNFVDEDKKASEIQPSKTFALLDYNFKRDGVYKIRYEDEGGNPVAEGVLTIVPKEDTKKKAASKEKEEAKFTGDNRYGKLEADYYNARILLGNPQTGNPPKDDSEDYGENFLLEGKTFMLPYCVLNDRALKTDSVLVNVYGLDGGDYTKLISTEKLVVDGDTNRSCLSQKISEAGQFEITIVNRYYQTIATRTFKVNK